MKIMVIGYDYFHYCQSLVHAYEALGHEVQRLSVQDFQNVEKKHWKIRLVKLGLRSLEKKYERQQEQTFIQKVDAFKPDVCILLNGNCLQTSFLLAVKKRQIKLILFMIDSLQECGFKKFLSRITYYDKIFSYESTDKDQLNAKNIEYLPIGYDETMFYPMSGNETKDIDISFVGVLDKKRLNFLEKIAEYASKANKKFVIHTKTYKEKHLWHKIKNQYKENKFKLKYPFLSKIIIPQSVYNEDLADIYRRSKICLNIYRDTGHHTDVNPRTFEIMACESFQLLDCGHLKNVKIESGKHVLEFDDLQDLCEKIDYYLNHDQERVSIANAGCLLVQEKYKMLHTAKQILS